MDQPGFVEVTGLRNEREGTALWFARAAGRQGTERKTAFGCAEDEDLESCAPSRQRVSLELK